jgi:hypothetical protein
MNLNTALILAFLFHLFGDYLIQNDWMAANKTKSSWAAFVHAITYSLPFLFLAPSYWWLLIFGSHFLIDRFRLAVYWIKLVNWNWQSENFGYAKEKPVWMSVWLMIIIDNTFHLLFNAVAIYLHFNPYK